MTAFAPLNVRDWKSPSGIIGAGTRASTTTNSASAANPSTTVATTSGWVRPRFDDSTRPKTNPPSTPVASMAPLQSSRPCSGLRLSGTRRSRTVSTAVAVSSQEPMSPRHGRIAGSLRIDRFAA